MSGVEKSMDGAGNNDLEIEVGFASLVAGDLLRIRGSDVGKGVGVGVLDKVSLLSASDSAHGVTEFLLLIDI